MLLFFAYSWNSELKLRCTFLRIQYLFWKVPSRTGLIIYVITPLLLFLCRSLLSHLPQIWPDYGRVKSIGAHEPGRDRHGSLLLHPGPQQAGGRGDDEGLAHQIWELKETALGSPFPGSALNFLGSLNQGVEIQATLLPNSLWGKRDVTFLQHRQVAKQAGLSPPL